MHASGSVTTMATAPCSCTLANRVGPVDDRSARAGMTEQRAEHAGFVVEQVGITDDEFDPHRLGPRPEHGKGLWVQVVMHEEPLSLRLRLTSSHRHRLGGRGGFVEQRCIGDVEAGELGHEGLEVEDRLESALADLGLVRRVGGVPGRVLEHVAGDHRRRDRAVVAHADQAGHDRVPFGDRAESGDRLVFRDGVRKRQRLRGPNRFRHRLIEQLVRIRRHRSRRACARGQRVTVRCGDGRIRRARTVRRWEWTRRPPGGGRPPLSSVPESLIPVGGSTQPSISFQRACSDRSGCLRDSGVVAPSAPLRCGSPDRRRRRFSCLDNVTRRV